jgi:hypothetical protein
LTTVFGMLLCVAAVALAACGSGASAAATPTTTARPILLTSTTPLTIDVDAEVLTAYRTMWADLVTAARTSDFQSPHLSQHASGKALSLLVQGLARDQLQNIVTEGNPVLDPRVTSLSPTGDPTHATIVDCFNDRRWVEYKTTGGLAKNTPGGRHATTADLVKKVGTWKVSQITIKAAGTC